MNITHFSWEYPPAIWGGLGTFAFEMTKKQSQLGHRVNVFSLNENNKLQIEEQMNGVTVFRPKTIELNDILRLFANDDVNSWGSHFQFFSDVVNYNITSARNFVEYVHNNKIKTVDIIDGHDWLGIIGALAAKKALSIPLVFHIHSTEHGRSLGGGSKTIRTIEFKAGQRADRIITVSQAMKKELVKLGFPKQKISVCWNGVDPEKYNSERFSLKEILQLRKKYHIKKDETMLFFVGRLVAVKGVDKLVKAMPSVLKKFPNCKLVILGVGDMKDLLLSLIHQLDLEDNVILHSQFVDEKERIFHYAASDVVILPSLYEPFGIVCTEAMSMSKPVVVGANGTNGMREQIIPEGKDQCGFHVNPHEPEDIAWGIKQILNMKDKGKQLGKNARKRVLKEFSWDIITQKTLNLYQEILN
jgi:glycosyltransferase involved in cell wall biosynthesis